MRRIVLYVAAIVSALGLHTATASAQSGTATFNAVGQWYCEWGTRSTKSGQAPTAVAWVFNMTVNANGTASGQGTEMGSTGQFPFTFQGQWQIPAGSRTLLVTGQRLLQDGLGLGPTAFQFGSDITGPDSLDTAAELQPGLFMASACRRQG